MHICNYNKSFSNSFYVLGKNMTIIFLFESMQLKNLQYIKNEDRTYQKNARATKKERKKITYLQQMMDLNF